MEQQAKQLYEFGPFRLDVVERLLLRAGEAVPLTPKSFDLLLALIAQPGHLLEKEALLKTVCKIEILENKMKADGLEMPREVVKYIAYNINSNVRELEGALISLLAQSSLNKREIDLELAKKVLRNFVKSSSKEITIDAIQKMVCEYFDVSYDKLLQKTRKREIVQARQITMFLSKAFTKNSLKTIGEHFGGRDHTTVIHSCQTVKDLMDTDNLFKESVLELQQKVQLAAM